MNAYLVRLKRRAHARVAAAQVIDPHRRVREDHFFALVAAIALERLRGGTCSFASAANGAGKSTLLRALAGLLKPASGQVTLHGKLIADYAPSERGKAIAWLAQQGETSGDLTARETVHLGRLPHIGLFGAPTAKDDAIVDAALAATESTAWQHRRLHQLSGGERQRVLLSRALASESPVLLLDEPTTHLDPPHQVALARLFRRLASTHTVITVLHDLPLAVQADRLLVMRDGAVAGHGESNDAALHATLIDAFDRAIAVIPATTSGERPTVSLRLDY